MIGAVVAALLLAFPPQAPPQNPPPPAAQAPPAGQAQPPPAKPPDPAQAKPPQPATPPKPWATFCCFEKGRAEKDGLVTVVYELSHVPSPPNPLNPPQHTQGLEEFQKMLDLCRMSYQELAPQPATSPHARFDVLEWVPLEP